MTIGGNHPFSTYAVRGSGGGVGGGGDFAYFPMYAHIKIAYREGEGGGSKMTKMLRTYYMDCPHTTP